jgi:hypothetical protein
MGTQHKQYNGFTIQDHQEGIANVDFDVHIKPVQSTDCRVYGNPEVARIGLDTLALHPMHTEVQQLVYYIRCKWHEHGWLDISQ